MGCGFMPQRCDNSGRRFMKKYEYMLNNDIENEYEKSGAKNYTQLFNWLGQKGWEIIPEPRPNSYGAYFARREITAEPTVAPKREMSISR